jgi:hypothetical protein
MSEGVPPEDSPRELPELADVVDEAVDKAVTDWRRQHKGVVDDAIARWQEAHGSATAEPTGYEEFEGSPAWTTIEQALAVLFERQELIEHPGIPNYYAIGYLVKKLNEAGLLDDTAATAP